MKKILFIALTLGYFSCGQKAAGNTAVADSTTVENKTEVVQKEIQPSGNYYRSDGFHNGIASEWIQVKYKEDGSEVEAMWYWDTNTEGKIRLTILSQTSSDGEISATTGTLKFPSSKDEYSFVIIEDRFGLTDSDERYQEFEHEGTDW